MSLDTQSLEKVKMHQLFWKEVKTPIFISESNQQREQKRCLSVLVPAGGPSRMVAV